MPRCSLVGCGARKSGNKQSLTLHRLPKSEFRKKKWLEAIGTENIRPNVKEVFICSLHFHEDAFNRTLEVTRLRDEAVPSLHLSSHTEQDSSDADRPNPIPVIPNSSHTGQDSSDEDRPNPIPVSPNLSHTGRDSSDEDKPNQIPVSPNLSHTGRDSSDEDKPNQIPVSANSSHTGQDSSDEDRPNPIPVSPNSLGMETIIIHVAPEPVPETSEDPLLMGQALEVKKLKDTCAGLRRKVRTLNEKVRRQKKRIEVFKGIIKNLQKRNLVNNESSIVLKARARDVGPKDVRNRQIICIKHLP